MNLENVEYSENKKFWKKKLILSQTIVQPNCDCYSALGYHKGPRVLRFGALK